MSNSAFSLWNHVLSTPRASLHYQQGCTACITEKQCDLLILILRSGYVGHTSQRLQDRIKQHVPKSIRSSLLSLFLKRLLAARWCKSSTQTHTQSSASDPAI